MAEEGPVHGLGKLNSSGMEAQSLELTEIEIKEIRTAHLERINKNSEGKVQSISGLCVVFKTFSDQIGAIISSLDNLFLGGLLSGK